MQPNSSTVSYVLPQDMINRHDSRLLCQLTTDNPFLPTIYAPYGPTQLAGTANVVNSSNQVVFTNPQSGITNLTCQFAGDSSGQTYIFTQGLNTTYQIYPVYGGTSINGINCTIVPTDTLSTNAYLLTALSAASGELESACLRGEFYAVTDLQSLQGVSLDYLKKIVSNIAIMNLFTRRDGPQPSDTVVSNYDAAMQSLNDLSSGKRIFSFAQTEQAGLPATYQMNPWNQIQNRMVTSTWQRMFGVRQNMRYPYVGGYGNNGGGYGGGCNGNNY